MVPFDRSLCKSLEYSLRARSRSWCLASLGKVYSSSHAIRGLSVAVPEYEYCKHHDVLTHGLGLQDVHHISGPHACGYGTATVQNSEINSAVLPL